MNYVASQPVTYYVKLVEPFGRIVRRIDYKTEMSFNIKRPSRRRLGIRFGRRRIIVSAQIYAVRKQNCV